MGNQETNKCPNCGGNLKININGDKLRCHYCGYENRLTCKADSEKKDKFWHYFWFGTENDSSIFNMLLLLIIPILSFLMLIIFVLIIKK